MKKFAVVMTIFIVIGVVLIGIGCAVFFTSDFYINARNIEYTEKEFESEDSFAKLDLRLENSHKVTLLRGEKCSVKYFDTNVTDFSVSVQDGTLIISESGWSWNNLLQRWFYKFRKTEVVITVPTGVDLDINGNIKGGVDMELPSWEYGNIDLTVSGAINVSAKSINATSIKLDVSGAATADLSGEVGLLSVHGSGAVVMDCADIVCPLINVNMSGSSSLNLSGTGSALKLYASGSGKIRAKNFALERVEIKASGSVDAELNVRDYLIIDVSGSANVAYWGDPKVEKSTSGSASIVKKD